MVDVAMNVRAADVRRAGSYIGLFEWLVFTELEHVSVLILFGYRTVNVRSLVGHILPALEPKGCLRAVGVCRTAVGNFALQGAGGSTNHWMVGRLTPGAAVVDADSTDAPASGQPGVREAVEVAAARVGWEVEEASPTGDCGIDVMAAYLGLPRVLKTFNKLRRRITDFIVAHASDPAWQEAFSFFGEVLRPARAPAVPVPAFAAAAPAPEASPPSAVAPGEVPSEPPPLPPPPYEVAPGEVSSEPPPLPPPPLQEDAKPSECKARGRTFQEYIASLGDAALASATSDYWSFRAVQERWVAANPRAKQPKELSRQQRAQHPYAYRLAVGMHFRRWAAGPGLASKAKLKVGRGGTHDANGFRNTLPSVTVGGLVRFPLCRLSGASLTRCDGWVRECRHGAVQSTYTGLVGVRCVALRSGICVCGGTRA